jgi:hypothetical protein
MENLKKLLSWKMLLIVGFTLHTIAYFIQGYYPLFSAVGVIGDIMFVLGLVNLIVYLVKKRGSKK